MEGVVDANDGLRKFIDRCPHIFFVSRVMRNLIAYIDDQHAHVLNPSFALSGASSPPSYSSMTSEELDAFLSEMEQEIRAADHDLREIETFESRGVLAAGKLTGTYSELTL